MAGFLCTAMGRVLAGAPTATSTVVWAPEVKSGKGLLIYTPESREAIVCEFLAQGNYAIAHHHCDLNLQPCIVSEYSLYNMTLQPTVL